jgi:hypothetical protein
VAGQGGCDGRWCNDLMMIQLWKTLLLLADGVSLGENRLFLRDRSRVDCIWVLNEMLSCSARVTMRVVHESHG